MIGIVSSTFQVYKCGNLSSELFVINTDEVNAKGYRMPMCDNALLDDSDSDGDDNMEYSKYVVATIIHVESM